MSSGTLVAIALSAVIVMVGVVAAILFEARMPEPATPVPSAAERPSDDHRPMPGPIPVPGPVETQSARQYTPRALR